MNNGTGMMSAQVYDDEKHRIIFSVEMELELPYDGAKDMILVDDASNREFLCKLVESM